MDERKYQASSCDALHTTEGESTNCVNYYDSLFCLSEDVKKEFPEDECSQSSTYQNEELLKCIPKEEIKQENSEESLSSIKNEVIDDEQYIFVVKIESPEEHSVLDNFGDAGVHYDMLITSEQVQCKLCSRTFENRFTLLLHNNEHIKVVLYPTLVDIEINELNKCQWCDEHFNSHDMLTHVCNVHNNKTQKAVLYNEEIKPYSIGYHIGKNGKEMEYKCDFCERVYKSKPGLESHKKNNNYDHGKIFGCWCGKQFCTPLYLRAHKRRHHKNESNNKFQCDYCHKFFKTKRILTVHIKSFHYDYGKIFECWCKKQFRTPIYLSLHKKRHHDANVKIINKQHFQCDYCHIFFKMKYLLARHIMSIHYDYGKTFECWCGKQFRTPIHLSIHKRQQNCTNGCIINNEQFQCYSCHKFFKMKYLLARHIKSVHYDYGKTFECSCGKQFRSPSLLSRHKRRQNCTNGCIINNEQFQCYSCHKFFKTKFLLARHIKRVHYDYGKTFECSCGKQFRTPSLLSRHKRRQICTDVCIINNEQFQCYSCHKFFKMKYLLASHIKSVHYDYCKTFECSCGKQFRSPNLLSRHKRQQNCTNGCIINNEQFQCYSCHKFFKTKFLLARHIKSVHYDYGKTFECSCGKQFRTPSILSRHRRQNCTDVCIINNEQFQCYSCQKFFKTKFLLARHIKSVHYDYGKTFECSCGKQFRSPSLLSQHKKRQICTDVCIINNEQFQCYSCHKFFKSKFLLARHIKSVHYDYGKTFECSCGKQFRSPSLLSRHKRRQICTDVCIINDEGLS